MALINSANPHVKNPAYKNTDILSRKWECRSINIYKIDAYISVTVYVRIHIAFPLHNDIQFLHGQEYNSGQTAGGNSCMSQLSFPLAELVVVSVISSAVYDSTRKI